MNITLKYLLFPLILFSGLAFYSCKKEDNTSNNINTITEKTWTLTSVQNNNSLFVSYFPKIQEKITIQFGNNKNLLLKGICNNGSAIYSIDGEKLTFSTVVITKIYCDNAEWEGITVNCLINAYAYEISGNRLIIYSTENSLVFE